VKGEEGRGGEPTYSQSPGHSNQTSDSHRDPRSDRNCGEKILAWHWADRTYSGHSRSSFASVYSHLFDQCVCLGRKGTKRLFARHSVEALHSFRRSTSMGPMSVTPAGCPRRNQGDQPPTFEPEYWKEFASIHTTEQIYCCLLRPNKCSRNQHRRLQSHEKMPQ